MPSDDITSLSHSADYVYIEKTLKSLWIPFCDLALEMKTFKPRPARAFREERNNLFRHYRELNPNQSTKSLLHLVNSQISISCRYDVRFNNMFNDRFMSQYILILFTSHALCEAVINAALAKGLHVKQKKRPN